MNKGFILAIVGVIALVFLIVTFGWVNIDPTEVGVEVNKIMGKVQDEPLGVGYHFFNRFKTDVKTYKVASRSFPSDVAKSEDEEKYTLEGAIGKFEREMNR